MDINDLRGIATLIFAIAFITVCIWAYSSKRKNSFDEAAQLPFADEEDAPKKKETPSDKESENKPS